MDRHNVVAVESFLKREYKKALLNYSLVLIEFPNDAVAKAGSLIVSMVFEDEDKARALFSEYYSIITNKDIDRGILSSVLDIFIENIAYDIEKTIEDSYNYMDKAEESFINYDDFLCFVKNKGSFKEAFEDTVFSSVRVLIKNRVDLIDFLEKLIQNNFIDIACTYLYSVSEMFPASKEVGNLYRKLLKKE